MYFTNLFMYLKDYSIVREFVNKSVIYKFPLVSTQKDNCALLHLYKMSNLPDGESRTLRNKTKYKIALYLQPPGK